MARTVTAEKAQQAQATVEAHAIQVSERAEHITDDAAKINTLIKQIKSTGATLLAKVELCAACCIVHAIKHGNTTPANNLIEALPPGWRSNSLRKWFQAYGPMVYMTKGAAKAAGEVMDEDERGKLYMDKSRVDAFKAQVKKDAAAFGTKLMTETFHQFDPEPEFDSFNFARALKALVKRGNDMALAQKGEKVKRFGRSLSDVERKRIDLTGLAEARSALSTILRANVVADDGPAHAEQAEETEEQTGNLAAA